MEFIQEQLNEIKKTLEIILQPSKDFMTLEEIADYLSISKSAVYKLTSKKEIPFYIPGGKKIYFKKEEVDDWIERSRVATDEETIQQLEGGLYNSKKPELW
jgi:excisionase family DNA binding protein|tara:strand:- start:3035 stop:3337 length:303 start_codon:yes stop_codon:yes gene_type:complete